MRRTLLFIVLLLTLTPALGTLQDYPEPFVTNGVLNAKLVVGENAATSDVIGGIDIAAGLVAEAQTDLTLGGAGSLTGSRIGVLDTNAPELGEEPMIVVGGPCANSVAAELMGYPQPCRKDFNPGIAKIQYYPQDEALLVAGLSAQETLAASYVVADHQDYNLTGNAMEVTIAEAGVLNIRQVE